MIQMNDRIYDSKGARTPTEEDNKEFQQALKEGKVYTHDEMLKPLNDWKRDQMSTLVKRKNYRINMKKFLTGKDTIIPNISKLRNILKK